MNNFFSISLSFCDLAGFERSQKTQMEGKAFKEASHINQSLLTLNRCIGTLIENQIYAAE